MATLIDGKKLANELNEQTKQKAVALTERGIVPGLAVIIVGDDPASQIYVRNKHRKAEELGIHSVVKHLPDTITQSELLQEVKQLNEDPTIHGILVQSPLPKPLDERQVTMTIDPKKDVDGFHPLNVGLLYTNMKGHYPVACTPKGIMTMLNAYQVELTGKHAVVIGRSNIVGRPMAALLMQANATVSIANRHTENLQALTQDADVLVVATGVAHLIKAADVKPGATVIDVGMDRDENGKLTGDVDFEPVSKIVDKITPVPGGVGPMTIATLMQQTVELANWSETSES